ncbi:tRNA-specific 2-thiouridylase MnmA, partial [Filimonas sp.]
MTVARLNMIKYDTISEGQVASTKIRYKTKGTSSSLYNTNGKVHVVFDEAVKGIAPGQSAVFYEGDDVIGGGIIQSYTSI